MTPYLVYIIDDDPAVCQGIALALEERHQVRTFISGGEALKSLETEAPDLVLLDLGLPDLHGLEVLRRMHACSCAPLVIVITGFDDPDTIVAVMKLGAYDYVVKPLHLEAIEVRVNNALQTLRLKKEVQELQGKYLQENLPFFIGASQAIQAVMELVKQVARSPDTPVLIEGETGTGKEWVAHAIHYHGPRFQGPLVTVNCAAIPRELVESELFGYAPGAFSGARTSGKAGLIEESAGGTLFLDEIGDLSLEAQAKILRFLENGEFYRLGSTKKHQVQTRVLAATNKDLAVLIKQGQFRQDLYFRLGVIRIAVPSLNQRREDIIPLAKHFLVEFSRKFGKSFTRMAPEAMQALLSFHWQGNVRELKNLLERAVLLGPGPILSAADLGLKPSKAEAEAGAETPTSMFPPLDLQGLNFTALQESWEKHYILEALKQCGNNESRAAELLGLNHHTFRYRRKKLLPKSV